MGEKFSTGMGGFWVFFILYLFGRAGRVDTRPKSLNPWTARNPNKN